ncbi:MAG: flagellar biosynthetic protein FliR [Alphaproteobacteria bacterium]
MTLTLGLESLYAFSLVFARLGVLFMLMPAVGEFAIPSRIKVGVAFLMALLLFPQVREFYPAQTPSTPALVLLLAGEMVIGLFIGASARLVMSALQVAGSVIAVQTGLAVAQSFDATQGTQTAIFSTFLGVLGVTLIFAFDLHHMLLLAMRDSFTLFKPGLALPVGDFTKLAITIIADAFRVGIQLAAPFLVLGLVFYMGLGILTRLMPQVQIFFVAMPANIFLGFVVLILLLSAMSMWFLEFFVTVLRPLVI